MRSPPRRRIRDVVRALVPCLLGVCTVAAAAAAERPAGKDTFPKIGGMYISTPPYENPAYQAQLAKHDAVILNFWKGWARQGKSARRVVQEIKALNPRVLIGNYTLLESVPASRDNAATREVYDKIAAEKGPRGQGDWWGRNSTGALVSHFAGLQVVNITEFATPDANGDRFPEWFARWAKANLFDPVPEFDIWYADNVLYQPRNDVDWDGDGVNDARGSGAVEAWFRQAIARHLAAVSQLAPHLLIMGNVDGQPGPPARGFLREPEYRGRLPAAFLESAMGQSFSIETWSTWENTLQAYRSLMENTAAPHLVMFNVKVNRGDYAAMRYGLATALLHDGYFSVNEGGYRDVVWFDEFDQQLGRAIDPPPTGPWRDGIYRRRFEHGMALVNPKGNTTRTVPIEAGYRRFIGTQDPVTNNGQPVAEVTLAARDGLILLRDASGGRPSFSAGPASHEVAEGATVVLRAEATGATSFQWLRNGTPVPAATRATLVIRGVSAADAGDYVCAAANDAGVTLSAAAKLSLAPPAPPGGFANLSLLVELKAGESVTLGAVTAGGARVPPILVRAAGPALAPLGVSNAAPDPRLQVRAGGRVIVENDNWSGAAALAQAFQRAGAFSFASGSADSAALWSEGEPGPFTVEMREGTARGGMMLAEIYASTSAEPATAARLVNLSALKRVDAGETVTAGFVIAGPRPATVLVRGVGRSLAPLGVTDGLPDPKIDVFAGQQRVAGNDDWSTEPESAEIARAVGAFALLPEGDRDAACVLTLAPGAYSVRLAGAPGSRGSALIEIYEVP